MPQRQLRRNSRFVALHVGACCLITTRDAAQRTHCVRRHRRQIFASPLGTALECNGAVRATVPWHGSCSRQSSAHTLHMPGQPSERLRMLFPLRNSPHCATSNSACHAAWRLAHGCLERALSCSAETSSAPGWMSSKLLPWRGDERSSSSATPQTLLAGTAAGTFGC